jgi:hypothetical protein
MLAVNESKHKAQSVDTEGTLFLSPCRIPKCARARSARVGIGERESRRAWGQQLVVQGQLHLPTGKLVMRVARVALKRARCFNSKGTSFHVVLELEHVREAAVDQRSAIRKADAVLPAFARAGQRHDTLKRVAQRGRCRLLSLVGVKHVKVVFSGFAVEAASDGGGERRRRRGGRRLPR